MNSGSRRVCLGPSVASRLQLHPPLTSGASLLWEEEWRGPASLLTHQPCLGCRRPQTGLPPPSCAHSFLHHVVPMFCSRGRVLGLEKTPRVIRSKCPPITPVSNPCPWKSVIPPARSVAGGHTALPRTHPTGERPVRQEGLPGPPGHYGH